MVLNNKMATQNMLRTHDQGKEVFSMKKNRICDSSRSNQMPLTDQITDFFSLRAHLFLCYHLISMELFASLWALPTYWASHLLCLIFVDPSFKIKHLVLLRVCRILKTLEFLCHINELRATNSQ